MKKPGSYLPVAAALVTACACAMACASPAAGAAPATAPVMPVPATGDLSVDGVVEAIRRAVVAAQVTGLVRQVAVTPGDRVRAGQVLVRIDGRVAGREERASAAQVRAAHAEFDFAARDYARQQQLYEKHYISEEALQRAEARFRASQAQTDARLAQADADATRSDFDVVTAPYDGVVADVPVAVGDMAMPGATLLTLYDPAALRVTAMFPQSVVGASRSAPAIRLDIPGAESGGSALTPVRVQVMPVVDAATHSVEVRMDLPRGLSGVVPGMFARVWMPVVRDVAGAPEGADRPAPPARLVVPAAAVVRRGEMTGLYVIDAGGRSVLRQVRLGAYRGGQVEILSGVSAGERVAIDPQVTAQSR